MRLFDSQNQKKKFFFTKIYQEGITISIWDYLHSDLIIISTLASLRISLYLYTDSLAGNTLPIFNLAGIMHHIKDIFTNKPSQTSLLWVMELSLDSSSIVTPMHKALESLVNTS